MAGDWIKVEHATLDKPEVLRAAEMLGISRREAIGLFFDYWIWLDKNLSRFCPGVVPNVSRKSLDEVLHTPGFSRCLEAIGWAKFDDAAWTLTVVNAERHNGNSAKARAYEQKKKANQRAESVPNLSPSHRDKTGTREEKRREEITTKSKAIARVPLAQPADEHIELARSLGVDCQAEFDKYRDHFAANGRRHKDEVAGFRNWLRRAATYVRAKPTAKHDVRAATAAAVFGGEHGKSDERVIDGQAERVA